MRAYPICTFSIKEDEDIFRLLGKIHDIGKSEDESKKDFYIWYMKSYMRLIRKIISESNNENIKKYINNYMSIYFEEDNTVGIIVYDAIKEDLDAYASVEYEEREDGRFYPYIAVGK